MFVNNAIISYVKLKYFIIFGEFFISILALFVLVVLFLLILNIYGILVQTVACEIISFIFIFTCFLMLKENIFIYSKLNYFQPVFFWFNQFLSFDLFSKLIKFFVSFFLIIYFLIIADFLKIFKLTFFEYLFLLVFASLGLLLLCSVNDFLLAFLSIELISLCSYLLASFKKNSSYSIEAGVKYLIIGAISSAFFLLGSSFIYGYTGSIVFTDIKFLFFDFSKLINFFLLTFFIQKFYYLKFLKINFLLFYNCYNFFIEISVLFILFSIFIKLALAPVHIWALEIYENSPSISTFFFTSVTKISFFVFLTKFCSLFQMDYGQFWFFLNFLVGFLSVFFGSFGGLKQKKMKTLLGYSSIAHMGYCLLVFNSFSVLGLEMVYFYLFTYVLSNIIIWFILLALKKIILKKKIIKKLTKSINDLVLLGKSHFFLSFCFIVAIFSLAGLPPLLGFLSKLNVFLVLFTQKFYIIILFVLLCSVISTFYYLRLIKILFFENILIGSLYFFNSNKILFCCLLTFLLIFLFINPTLFYLVVYKMILFENFKNKFILFHFKNFSKNLNFNNFEINSKLYFIFDLVLL